MDRQWVRRHREIRFDEELRKRLRHPDGRILCYGVGTVAEMLLQEIEIPAEQIDFAPVWPKRWGAL
ncbi:MAG: hypothetical protein R2864_03840 [Syntrophotaleaceae bacterium]